MVACEAHTYYISCFDTSSDPAGLQRIVICVRSTAAMRHQSDHDVQGDRVQSSGGEEQDQAGGMIREKARRCVLCLVHSERLVIVIHISPPNGLRRRKWPQNEAATLLPSEPGSKRRRA